MEPKLSEGAKTLVWTPPSTKKGGNIENSRADTTVEMDAVDTLWDSMQSFDSEPELAENPMKRSREGPKRSMAS
jgi:hypothetical protein